MLRSLLTAEKAMHYEQTRIDTLANNLANVNSSGFKQILTRVTESAAAAADGPVARDAAAGSLTSSYGAWPTVRPLDMQPAIDVRQGELEATGRGTDLALQGDGFFVVQDPEGNEFFTRDGSFRLDEQHRLVTAQGYLVQGTGGEIALDGDSFAFATDGTVSVDGTSPGRVRVVTFAEPGKLEHRGDSLLAAGQDNPPVDAAAGTVTVAQGYLERSNVDAIRTLVNMIEAQRAFEIESKVLTTSDQMLERSTGTLGRNP